MSATVAREVARETLEEARRSIIAAAIGSCTCHTKTHEASMHAADCRYLKLMSALDSLDSVWDLTTQAPDQSAVSPAPEVATLRAQVRRYLVVLKRYRDAMENVCDELEEDFDTVDGGDGQPAPNKAMRLASELKEAIYGPGAF